ncbi:hypothetical protein GC102_30405 [Paenibacillus sp. LMG 31460]|uniref:Uncharacterized protein n=1 Tax=Paenibacillus germinis TaxID=2654979 RepID=A0ABX1ZDJ8_9BACL|nr:hypothetical protein [Paenibacillus germinis]NOU90038.1 hypothetical protein [Paenibacillus germinis]
MDARDSLSRSRFPASRTLSTSSGSQSSRCKRGIRAYLFGRSRISAFSELNQHGCAGQSAEKSIYGFSDSVKELRLDGSHYKRGIHAYLFGRSRLSAFSELNQQGCAGQSAEKSISGFSDSVDELQLVL